MVLFQVKVYLFLHFLANLDKIVYVREGADSKKDRSNLEKICQFQFFKEFLYFILTFTKSNILMGANFSLYCLAVLHKIVYAKFEILRFTRTIPLLVKLKRTVKNFADNHHQPTKTNPPVKISHVTAVNSTNIYTVESFAINAGKLS